MLILTCDIGKTIQIGDHIRITVLDIIPGHKRRVRLGVETPEGTRVVRVEVGESDDTGSA